MSFLAIASLFLTKAMAPQLEVPVQLQDRAIFTYLKPGKVWIEPQGKYYAFDKLPEVAAKPDAAKLKVVLVVAERHFGIPTLANIIERRDRDRIVALLPLAASYLRNYSGGDVEVTITPKFFSDPVFDFEAMELGSSEFNRNKFDADDSVERGPYDLSVTIESKDAARYVGDPKIGAGQLAGDVVGAAWQALTPSVENMFLVESGKVPKLTKSLVGYLQGTSSFTNADADLFSGEPTMGNVGVVYPILLSTEGGALDLTEECLIRRERMPLPFNEGESTAKSLSFEYKTFTRNPVAVQIQTASGWEELTLPGGAEDWKSAQVKSSKGEAIINAMIGVPTLLQNRTRSYSELCHYQFRNFAMTGEANGTATESVATLQQNAPDPLKQIPNESFAELKARLTSLNTSEAVHAARTLYTRASTVTPSAEELAFLNSILTGPYAESVRAEGLSWIGKIPGLGAFPLVAPNAVRDNWQVRRAAIKALSELEKAGVKEKEGCKQLMLMSTAQEMGLIRHTAYAALNFEDEETRKRAEYALINDPSEYVRILLARKLALTPTATFDSVKGVLADESISVRSNVARVLRDNELSRKLLQNLVVDSSPKVRASALYCLASIKGVQVGEIQNTFSDTDPVVQHMLAVGASQGAWTLPAELVAKLKASPFKGTAKAAEAIK